MEPMSLLVILLILYFLPTLIAFLRSHRQTTAVFVFNLFAKWILIGGLVALEWACTTDVKPRAPTLLSKGWKSRDLVESESEPRTPRRSFTKREWAAVAGLTVAITVFLRRDSVDRPRARATDHGSRLERSHRWNDHHRQRRHTNVPRWQREHAGHIHA